MKESKVQKEIKERGEHGDTVNDFPLDYHNPGCPLKKILKLLLTGIRMIRPLATSPHLGVYRVQTKKGEGNHKL